MRLFVDTNYFLRLLLKDNSRQSRAAKKLFLRGAKGEVELISSTIVLFEIYWVLSSFYQQEKEAIIPILREILEMTFVAFAERDVLWEAVELFGCENIELEDCYNLVYSRLKQVEGFRTFDKKLRNRL